MKEQNDNWHLQAPSQTPAQIAEAANDILLKKYPDTSQINLATLTFSYIRREWWVTFCKKEGTPDDSVLEVTFNDNTALSIAGIKWGSEEWQWS